MSQLWIKFTDDDGEFHRLPVDKEVFVIGRGSTCDLVVPNAKLSREHLRIENSNGRFIVADCGSSNGTELNYGELTEPTVIRNGDQADLGGGLAIEFELEADQPIHSVNDQFPSAGMYDAGPAAGPPNVVTPVPGENAGGFPIGILIVGPLAAIFLIVIGIGLIYMFSSPTTTAEAPSRTTRTTREPSDEPEDNKPSSSRTPASSSPTIDSNDQPSTGNASSPLPKSLGETSKVESNAAAFLRRIAHNDSTAFLTTDQAQKVNSRIKQLSGSSSLAANIESARKSSSQLKTLAGSKNLPPQFLATAALSKLGTSRGDPLQMAQSMSDVFEKLNTQIGSELSDDSLMMVAAFDQGQRGDFMGLRNTLQDLANKFPDSSRAIRSIWFLQKQGKISGPEFDFAIMFLAVGTISQNPKDFGVNAEPLIL